MLSFLFTTQPDTTFNFKTFRRIEFQTKRQSCITKKVGVVLGVVKWCLFFDFVCFIGYHFTLAQVDLQAYLLLESRSFSILDLSYGFNHNFMPLIHTQFLTAWYPQKFHSVRDVCQFHLSDCHFVIVLYWKIVISLLPFVKKFIF